MDDGGWDGGCGVQGVCMTIYEHHMTVYGGGIATARWDGVVAGWAVRRRDCVSGWWLDRLILADGAGTECVTVWSGDWGSMEAYDIFHVVVSHPSPLARLTPHTPLPSSLSPLP